MVQRYEQMRRLQWYKCGAAYKDFPLLYVKNSPKNLEVTNIQRIFAEDKLHSAKYSSKLDILRSFALSLQNKIKT